MMKLLAAFVSILLLLAEPAPSVTGTWNLGLQGDHVIPVALVLKQDGTKVTGTIALPTNHTGDRVEVNLTGEFASNALKLSGTLEHGPSPATIGLTAKLTDEGSLEGT